MHIQSVNDPYINKAYVKRFWGKPDLKDVDTQEDPMYKLQTVYWKDAAEKNHIQRKCAGSDPDEYGVPIL